MQAPPGGVLVLDFKDASVSPDGGSVPLQFSSTSPDLVGVGGLYSEQLGRPSLQQSRLVSPVGWRDGSFPVWPSKSPVIERAALRVWPSGWNAGLVSIPVYVRWRRFLTPDGLGNSQAVPAPYSVRLAGGYQPAPGSSILLNFAEPLVPPPGELMVLEFGASGYTRALGVTLGNTARFGIGSLSGSDQLRPAGIASRTAFGVAKVEGNVRYVSLSIGIPSPGAGTPAATQRARAITVAGLSSQAFGAQLVFNFRQYVRPQGYVMLSLGTPYASGGVKTVFPGGYQALTFGPVSLVNTTANQSARPSGIASAAFGALSVSPRMIRPTGVVMTAFGTPYAQRNPAPVGFNMLAFGYPTVEYKTKRLAPTGIQWLEAAGYPRVYDPTQKVLASSRIQTAIFGDIAVSNKRLVVSASGFDSGDVSPRLTTENNRRIIPATGWVSLAPGNALAANKTPSIAPIGFNSYRPSSSIGTAVGYRLRQIYFGGINSAVYGAPTVIKTPELLPLGFSGATGAPTVWRKIRTLEVSGKEATEIPAPTAWFRYRKIGAQGYETARHGEARLEHSRRTLLGLGYSAGSYGAASLTFGKRFIAPASVYENFAANHMVGGRRFLGPAGFVATAFGARIIPPQTQVYALGFFGAFGSAALRNTRRLLSPSSITVGQQAADAWGTARAFNLRQHVSMSYDVDSGLNPPAWPQWTSIVNRTKSLGITGSLMSRVAEPSIDNKARPLHPAGVAAPILPPEYRSGMVAYRVRSCRLEGLEAPYMSTWLSVLNDGRVLAPKGYAASAFGVAGLVNTRRYYSRVGAFDSAWFGYPMVADRIRTITADPRYSIAPPIIRLPEVKQYTRYIDGAGYESAKVGGHSLTVRFNRITPRWTLQNLYGSPIVKNLTPELGQRGRAADEYGDAQVRLQWRPVAPYDSLMQAIGKPGIAYRDRTVFGQGFNAMSISDKLVVTKTGAPPYSTQRISLEKFSADGTPLELGDGINLPGFPDSPFGLPIINQQVVYHHQNDAGTLFGMARITANTVRVEPGYGELLVGDPMVSLKKRTLTVKEWPDELVYQPSRARVSPHTIYATTEASNQAKNNHPTPLGLHPVDGYYRSPGVIFGSVTITLQHRTIRAYPATPPQIPGVTVANKRHYILAAGIRSLRFGWHTVPGPQAVVQFDSVSHAVVGVPTVARPPYIGPITLPLNGLNAHGPSLPRIELLNRQLRPVGYDALLPGSIFYGDGPYQWRGLRVGPLVPTMPKGASMQAMGAPWISFRVRNLGLAGFDSFISEYDLMNFAKRMRVIRQPLPRPSVSIAPVGFVAFASAASNVRHGIHYIRPDGNADQYRKGAF